MKVCIGVEIMEDENELRKSAVKTLKKNYKKKLTLMKKRYIIINE